MSNSIVKIIPNDPFCKLSVATLQKAKSFLGKNIDCDSIEIECNDTPVFVDCGGNLEKISCPECGEELSFDWWGEAMNKASENEFVSLQTKLPCCEKVISLNDLKYYFPCGFSCCVINLVNPICSLEDNIIDSVKNILGVNLRIIEANL